MTDSSIQPTFSPTTLVGWRLNSLRESGVSAALGELAESPGGLFSAAGIRIVRAAIALQRPDLVGDQIARLETWFDQLIVPRRPAKTAGSAKHLPAPAEPNGSLTADEEGSVFAEAIRLAADLRQTKQPGSIDLEALVTRAIHLVRATPTEARGVFVEISAAMMTAHHLIADSALQRAIVSTASSVIEAVGGKRMVRLFELGGSSYRVLRLVETIALLGNEPRRAYLRAEALRQFDNLVSTRLYVTGGVAQQPGSHLLVRSFGMSHFEGASRPCDTLALLELTTAMRPILVAAKRPTQADQLIELITYNAAMTAISSGGVHWFGPIPHGIDSTDDVDVFSDGPPLHPYLTGRWRPQLRSGAATNMCCASSALLSLCHIANQAIAVDPYQATIELRQLAACEATGEGWSLSVSGQWPYEEHVTISLTTDATRSVRIRIPEWADHPSAGEYITERFAAGTHTVALETPLVPRLLSAHPSISDIRGRVAIALGPMIYCLEGADQIRHTLPNQVNFDPDGGLGVRRDSEHPEAYPTIHATGDWLTRNPWPDFPSGGWRAYRPWIPESLDLPVEIVFIPFFAISNRGLWDTAIWIPLANSH